MLDSPKNNQSHFVFKKWSCPTCKQSDERFLGYRGGKYQRYGQGLETQIVKCRQCSLLFPNPFPIPQNPQELYGDPDKYFFLHDENLKIEEFKGLAKEILRRAKTSQPRLVDVGAGRGELLVAAKRQGISGIGLEFSNAMIAHAFEKYGITLIQKTIEDFANENEGQFDVVTLSAILEHVHDPDSMIQSSAKLLTRGGVLYIDVPNEPNLLTFLGNLSNRVRGNRGIYNLSPTWSPYHVYGFNRRSISILLKKHGLSVEAIRIKGGTKFPSNGKIADRLKAFIGTNLVHVGNLTRTANNMTVWAKKIN